MMYFIVKAVFVGLFLTSLICILIMMSIFIATNLKQQIKFDLIQ